MSTFSDDAEVEVQHDGPLPGPGHRFPQAGVTLTEAPQIVSGAQANTMREMLPHTFVTAEDVTFNVVAEGTEPDEDTPGATDAAADLADEAGLDLADIEGSGKDGRITKSDVASAIDSE